MGNTRTENILRYFIFVLVFSEFFTQIFVAGGFSKDSNDGDNIDAGASYINTYATYGPTKNYTYGSLPGHHQYGGNPPYRELPPPFAEFSPNGGYAPHDAQPYGGSSSHGGYGDTYNNLSADQKPVLKITTRKPAIRRSKKRTTSTTRPPGYQSRSYDIEATPNRNNKERTYDTNIDNTLAYDSNEHYQPGDGYAYKPTVSSDKTYQADQQEPANQKSKSKDAVGDNDEKKDANANSSVSNPLPVWAVLVSALLAGIVGTALVMLVWSCCLKHKQRRNTSSNATLQLTDTQTQRSSAGSMYETIPEYGSINPSIHSRAVDMSQRPLPFPEPSENFPPTNTENPYLQYDTVYEHRVFRLGRDGPVIHVSDRCLPIVPGN